METDSHQLFRAERDKIKALKYKSPASLGELRTSILNIIRIMSTHQLDEEHSDAFKRYAERLTAFPKGATDAAAKTRFNEVKGLLGNDFFSMGFFEEGWK